MKKNEENERNYEKVKMKNEKNEKNRKWKMKKNEKKKKNNETWRKMKKFGFHTQNPLRFPRFTVVVVTFCVKILIDFCFGMCLFPDENQQPVLRVRRFSQEKFQFSLDVKQKHTCYRRKSTKKIAKVSPFIDNFSFRII